jgi:hypothetical protein
MMPVDHRCFFLRMPPSRQLQGGPALQPARLIDRGAARGPADLPIKIVGNGRENIAVWLEYLMDAAT